MQKTVLQINVEIEIEMLRGAFYAALEFGDIDGLIAAFETGLDAYWREHSAHTPDASLICPTGKRYGWHDDLASVFVMEIDDDGR